MDSLLLPHRCPSRLPSRGLRPSPHVRLVVAASSTLSSPSTSSPSSSSLQLKRVSSDSLQYESGYLGGISEKTNGGGGGGDAVGLNAKLVLLGDMGAGKSSLVLRFVKGQFLEFQESTIGAAFFSQTLAVNDATVKFEIWDTAGQERYHSLAPMYYRGAAAAIIVYDITSTESFERAKKWVQELQKQAFQKQS